MTDLTMTVGKVTRVAWRKCRLCGHLFEQFDHVNGCPGGGGIGRVPAYVRLHSPRYKEIDITLEITVPVNLEDVTVERGIGPATDAVMAIGPLCGNPTLSDAGDKPTKCPICGRLHRQEREVLADVLGLRSWMDGNTSDAKRRRRPAIPLTREFKRTVSGGGQRGSPSTCARS